MQRTITVTIVAFAILLAGCGGDSAAADAQACAGCHQGKRTLADMAAAELAGKLRRIRDGELRHPPLGLDDDSDAALDALADELTDE